MIYAIPYQYGKISVHFARAKQIMLVNDETGKTEVVANPAARNPSSESRDQLIQLFRMNRVDAVILRHIGRCMLKSLFNDGLKVFRSPEKTPLSEVFVSELTPIQELDQVQAASENRRMCCSNGAKQHQHCGDGEGGHQCCHH
ncbi:NifB/NifX family molybdenum-iron cluster-binding protein [Teredinibacter sp. KSP-S5-2]|uniref:NifB/NifX family molybdenum-iron cluster-binding protein n=1 Tax=Teredinibacter sp. KSP-S5-2 TaxID=3034506 RepID=UPI0029351568|nr:NifB/NifX family molybdenum-iron cluster-binding protein [Teredinibacter sp. KSP-S5-2]WNO11515.1 NifB/NifX family molybdenum-iron cluster-binding protein [Teredinibacter sp. KSP-S5-2]